MDEFEQMLSELSFFIDDSTKANMRRIFGLARESLESGKKRILVATTLGSGVVTSVKYAAKSQGDYKLWILGNGEANTYDCVNEVCRDANPTFTTIISLNSQFPTRDVEPICIADRNAQIIVAVRDRVADEVFNEYAFDAFIE